MIAAMAFRSILPTLAFVAAFANAALAWTAPARAQAAGSAIAILVGFGPAQGNDQPARPDAATMASNRMSPDMSYDQTARFLARHLGRHLPGAPALQAKHTPGGAGLVAARRLASAPADGSVIGLLSSNVIFGSALRLPGADVAAASFVWLGGIAPDAWACIRTSASAGKSRVFAGSLGAGSRADVHARAMRDEAGYPIEIASGYISRFELVRALENGELDAACGWPLTDLERRHREWIGAGKMLIVGLFGRGMNGPTHAEWMPEGDTALLFGALSAEADIAWPLAAPPATPAAIAARFSDALQALAYDRIALEEALRAGITLNPVEAATINQRVHMLHALPGQVRARLQRLYSGAS
jgi:tripartite-type tricarboxylate transporter receptor subunit TctC